MITTRMSSPPFDNGDLVSCLDLTGEESYGLVVDVRVTPGAFRDSSCTVPAYEVDVLFGRLNAFLRVVSRSQDASSGILTVSDTTVERLHVGD